MTIPEILAALSVWRGTLPRKALNEAIAQREAITPELLRILEESTRNLARVAADPDALAHLCAMYLLAQFREPRAYPLLATFLRGDPELVDRAVGDISTEALDRMLASVCGGDTSLIEQVIEDPTVHHYARATAMGALVILVAEGVKPREELMAYLTTLFRGKLERKHSFVWDQLVIVVADLCPTGVMEDVEKAYADGLVDATEVRLEELREALEDGEEQALATLRRNRRLRFITDAIGELEWWLCPVPVEPKARRRPPPPAGPSGPSTPRRNDPCPCGSGKKYKRCCGP